MSASLQILSPSPSGWQPGALSARLPLLWAVVLDAASLLRRFLTGFSATCAAPFPTFYGAGSWAEYCAVNETALVAVPDNVPDEVAAQFFVSF